MFQVKEEKTTDKQLNNFISPPPVSSVPAAVFTIKTEKNTEISEECITTGISDGRETNIKIKTEKETERITEQISVAQGVLVNIKTESESEKVEQVVSEPTATVNCELPSVQIKKEPAAKRPMFGAANGGPASKRPSQAKDPNDPWFAAYEAKRQEALNNMKQGKYKISLGCLLLEPSVSPRTFGERGAGALQCHYARVN